MASSSGHPTSGRRGKYKSPATRAAEEAADLLEPLLLPERLRGDDGPSGNEEESEAKRPRSTSTTPKSGRGIDPDDYDRLMGISSVNPSEEDRFGDWDVTDMEAVEEGVANDSMTPTSMFSGSGNCPGADVESRGYGRASLMECLDRSLSRVPSLAALLPAPLREQLKSQISVQPATGYEPKLKSDSSSGPFHMRRRQNRHIFCEV